MNPEVFVGRWLDNNIGPDTRLEDIERLIQSIEADAEAAGVTEEQVIVRVGGSFSEIILEAVRNRLGL